MLWGRCMICNELMIFIYFQLKVHQLLNKFQFPIKASNILSDEISHRNFLLRKSIRNRLPNISRKCELALLIELIKTK